MSATPEAAHCNFAVRRGVGPIAAQRVRFQPGQ